MGKTNVDWFFMRLILSGKTNYTEIDERLSLCDVLDLHEALDIEEEIQDFLRKRK